MMTLAVVASKGGSLTNWNAWYLVCFFRGVIPLEPAREGKIAEIDRYASGGDYYINDIFVGLDVSHVDGELGYSDTSLYGELGYFVGKDWLVSVSGSDSDSDFTDSLALNTKYIATLDNGAFVNVEASFLNNDNDFNAAADYFWTAQSSAGLSLSTTEGYNFGINAEHFFTPAISAHIEYVSLDFDDAISVGVTGRF